MAFQPNKPADLLSIGDTAQALGIKYKKLWSLVYRDEILEKPKGRFGRRCFFKQQQIPTLLQTLAEHRMTMKGGA